MFSSTLFNWTPQVEKIDQPTQEPAASAIVKMLKNNAPENEIIAAIDKLTLVELNEPITAKSGGFVETYDNTPKISLLRIVHAWLFASNNETPYPALEQHLLERGVEQDFVYQWAAELHKEMSKPEDIFARMSFFTNYTNYSNYDITYFHLRELAEKHEYLSEVAYRHELALKGGFDNFPKPENDPAFQEAKDLTAKIKKLIDSLTPEQINQRFRFYDITLLHFTASCGLTEMTEYLLHKHADVNAIGSDLKMTPLLFTLASPNCNDNGMVNETANILLKHGADINAKSICQGNGAVFGRTYYGSDETALDICAKRMNDTMTIQLLKLGMDSYATKHSKSQEYVNDICEKNGIHQRMRSCNLL